MWKLIKSLFIAIFNVIATMFNIIAEILKIILNILGKLISEIVEIVIWVFKNVLMLYFDVLFHLIRHNPVSFITPIVIFGSGYFIVQQWEKKKGINDPTSFRNLRILFVICILITFFLIGLVAGSGPVSIVTVINNIIIGGSSVKIVSGGIDRGFLGVPTSIWAALISTIATIVSALIAVKRK